MGPQGKLRRQRQPDGLLGRPGPGLQRRRPESTSLKRAGGSALAATYAGANQAERATAGSTTFTNTLLGVSAGGTTGYTRDPAGGLVGIRGTNRSYYLFDGLGSVVAVTSSSGSVTNSYTYDPFGVTTETKALLTNVFNPWRYAGQYQDTTTGLYKMGARYYQPELGRWTQPDPSGQDANTYLYVGANPVNFIDPSGLGFLGIDCPFGETDSGGCNGAPRSFVATATTGFFAGSVAVAACPATAGVGCPAAVGATAGTTKFLSGVTQGKEPGEALTGAACTGVAAGIGATGVGLVPGAALGASCP